MLARKHLIIIIYLFFLKLICANVFAQGDNPPNIVLIIIDDLNDYPQGFGGHPQTITPHMKALGDSGVRFLKAYSNNPMCGPSRASMFTGVYPHNSSNLWMKSWFHNEVLANTKTMMEKFKESGYYVVGSGKVLHHNKKEVWSNFKYPADYSPFPYAGDFDPNKKPISHPDVPAPFRTNRIVDGLNMGGGFIDGSYGPMRNFKNETYNGEPLRWVYGGFRSGKELRYENNENRDLTPDEINANWAEKQLFKFAQENNDKPFFLSVGFVRPHTPLIVPQNYFDLYPLETLQLADILTNDKLDTYLHLVNQFETPKRRTRSVEMFQNLVASYDNPLEGLKRFTQAYLACVTAVDDNVGKIMDVINNSSLKDNTVVVLTSDHGWTMGEKEHIYKNSLWEESTRVPLIIRLPKNRMSNSVVEHPVSLIDIYPTLLDLAGIEDTNTKKNELGHGLDGNSLVPFLNNPNTTEWSGPEGALSILYSGDVNKDIPSNHHYSVRTKNFRYIIYNTGQEELYETTTDPKEKNNLVFNASHPKIASLRMLMQQITYPIVPQGMKYVK